MNVKRVLIEKKPSCNTESKGLINEFKGYLGIENLSNLRVVNVYHIVNATEEETNKIVNEILFEKDLDYLYMDDLNLKENEKTFRVEYVRGQYNQRQNSTKELIRLLTGREDIFVDNSKILIFENITDKELEKIKEYYINPIEMKEVPIDEIVFHMEEDIDSNIEIIDNFIFKSPEELVDFKNKYGIGMDLEDLIFCQSYFVREKRNPSITEIKLIDTYWSDHCRHSTFMAEITDISIEEGKYKSIFENALKEYIASREFVYGEKERVVSLMDLATINMKEIKKKGLLEDKEESEEVNAASIEIDVDVNGVTEKWLLMFKNETHNHPTEMEPFGGASTCLGGAIRDPLSGRAYVYQAMRITGAADPRVSYENTLKGKLPQRKITQTARLGYSSYGYEIGGATGYLREIYDDGFVAKRMELGALVAAAPKDAVYRGEAVPSDVVILVGGKTGRDGLGGAVGSSKEHSEESLNTSGAEVQKGNPAVERKIVRLFRDEKVSRLIKKCNDFGAGGVAVAVGELADGLLIQLDKVPLKYLGLDGTEIALSESQERMAVVVSKKDLDEFMTYAKSEDVEATIIAEVTEEKVLKMVWKNQEIVNIKREFLDTNGIRKKAKVNITSPSENIYFNRLNHIEGNSLKELFINNAKDLNIASQKGMIEGFDHTVGAGTVLMPLGGKKQLTPIEGMVAKIPVLNGETTTCSMMTYGYDPNISKWSTFHGGYYAVIESIAKIVALGGDYKKIRLTFQEYFEKIGNDPSKWGKPMSALLGAFMVQKSFNIPSIGGKDSMSGTFEDINVPPTLVSFAVTTDKVDNIVSSEFKKANSKVVLVELNMDEKGLLDLEQVKINYEEIKKLIDKKQVLATSVVKFGGVARNIVEMTLGNSIGFEFEDISKEELFKHKAGSIVMEVVDNTDLSGLDCTVLGKTTADSNITLNNEKIYLDILEKEYKETLNDVFPINKGKINNEEIKYTNGNKVNKSISIAKPKVLIPIFTGTHGEYTLTEAFKKAGADVDLFIFKTLKMEDIKNSYVELINKIKSSNIIALPDGAILGNEPETAGKLIKLIMGNEFVMEELNNHLSKRDGLILGVGAGAIGLAKLGLIDKDMNIVNNQNGQFISSLVDVKVTSNLSPWFSEMKVGNEYTVPLATKEGRIISTNVNSLFEKGQISTQYVDENLTGSTMDIESITNENGRVLATTSAIDRIASGLYKNIDFKGEHKIFQSGVNYFK